MPLDSEILDIREIRINSLLAVSQDEGFSPDMFIDDESKIRVVPFLSRFGKLNQVVFGIKNRDTGKDMDEFAAVDSYFDEESDQGYPFECPRESMLGFLDMVSGGFICGSLPKHLKILYQDCVAQIPMIRMVCVDTIKTGAEKFCPKSGAPFFCSKI